MRTQARGDGTQRYCLVRLVRVWAARGFIRSVKTLSGRLRAERRSRVDGTRGGLRLGLASTVGGTVSGRGAAVVVENVSGLAPGDRRDAGVPPHGDGRLRVLRPGVARPRERRSWNWTRARTPAARRVPARKRPTGSEAGPFRRAGAELRHAMHGGASYGRRADIGAEDL